ncbi:hypothetical protein DPMN_107699 [Dreissena polymorpha]|uniref:Uncharacterized protein n=1 Tax=Dreissena polymorpha TaxID=45954 RepID=A0A9D4QK71_DREPO|nr:hypothetical protein DPMN_107699 [Dreissena polymorpha]
MQAYGSSGDLQSPHAIWDRGDLQNGNGLNGYQSYVDLSVSVTLLIGTECQYFG